MGKLHKEKTARAGGRRLSRVLSWSRWGLLLVCLGLGVCYYARARLFAPTLRSWASDYAREQLGAELEIGELGGSWFGGLLLGELTWSAQASPLVALQRANLRADYSLPGLLFGQRTALNGLEISAQGIELDLQKLPSASADEETTGTPLRLPNLKRIKLNFTQIRLLGLGTRAALELDELALEGSLLQGRLRLKELRVTRGTDQLLLSNLRLDLEADSLADLIAGLDARLRLELRSPEALWAGGPLPPGLQLDWTGRLTEAGLSLEGELRLEGGKLRLERGGLSWPASLRKGTERPWRALELDLDLTAEFEQLGVFTPLLGMPLGGSLAGELKLRGSLGEPLGMLRGEIKSFQVEDFEADLLQLDLEARRGAVLIRSLGAKDRHFSAQAKGQMALNPLGFEQLSVTLATPDLSAVYPGLPIAEELQLELELRGALDALQGSYRLSSRALAFGDQEFLSLEMEGSFDPGGLSFSKLRALNDKGSIEASGHLARLAEDRRQQLNLDADHFSLRLDELRASARGLGCALIEPHSSILGSQQISVRGMRLSSDSGEARLDLAQDQDGLRLEFSVEDFNPGPLLAPFLQAGFATGTLAGKLMLSLPPEGGAQPELQALLQGQGLVPLAGGPSWTWQLDAQHAQGILDVRNFEADSSTGASLHLVMGAPVLFSPEPLSGSGEVALALELEKFDLAQHLCLLVDAAKGYQGAFDGTLSAHGSWDALGLSLSGSLKQMLAPVALIDLGGRRHKLGLQLELGVGAGDSSLQLEGALQASMSGAFDWDGNLRALLAAPDPLELVRLQAAGLVQASDLAWLAKLSPITRSAQGVIRASLDVAGPLSALQTTGELVLEEGAWRISKDLPLMRELKLSIGFDENYTLALTGSGELGGAPFALAGTVQTIESQPILDLRLSGDNLLLVRSAELRLRAGLQLQITGPSERLKIAGSVELIDGRLARNMDLLNGLLNRSRGEASAQTGLGFSLAHEGPLASAEFDVQLRSKNAFWLDSNLAQIRLLPELHMTGTGEVPIFTGSVYVAPSTLKLPSGRLNIRSGQLEFLPGDPFEPRLAVQSDMNAQGYRLQAVFGGTLSQPEILLSSQPPLASDELMLLFLTGRKPAGTSDQALQSVAIYLANDFLTSWFFEKDADAAEGFAERFEYEVGASLSRSGATTGRATFLLHKRRDGPGRSQYLVADRDDYDHLNFGIGILFRFR